MSGRQSFAFQAAAPVQGQSTATGQSRGARIIGGQTQGGAVAAGPQTNPGPMAGQLGEFFGELMKPYVERKQQEKFWDGFTAAASGQAIKDLSHPDNPVTKIFGPSGFAEGAQFYTAQKALADHGQWLTDHADDLKKLPPEELSKMLAEKSLASMTGDHYVDQMIQAGLVKQYAPAIDAITKKRVEWQQQNATLAFQAAGDSTATAHQKLRRSMADVTALTDQQVASVRQSEQGLYDILQQPPGMTDDVYHKGLYNFMRAQMANGNFFAVEALKRKGIYGIFDDKQRTELEDAETRYAHKVLGDAAMDPQIVGMTAAIHADIESGRLKVPMEAAKRLAAVNATLRARTGVDEDLYDVKAVTNVANAVTDAAVAAQRRAETRQWQIEDRNAQWKHEQDVEDRKREQNAAQVRSFFAGGNAALGLAKNLGSPGDYDSVSTTAYANGDMGLLAKNFVGTAAASGYVSPSVARTMQSQLAASGTKYTPAFDTVVGRWQQLDKASPGAAAAYAGPLTTKLKVYTGMVGDGVPNIVAYERVFGETAGDFNADSVAPGKRQELRLAVGLAVSGMTRSIRHPLNYSLPDSSQNVIASVIGRESVALLAHTGMSPEAVVSQTMQAARANGHFELYGRFAWPNEPGTKPLTQLLHAQQGEMDRAVMQVFDKRLKAAGFLDGAQGNDYTIHRFGNDAIYVLAYGEGRTNGGGDHREIVIKIPELKAALDKSAVASVQRSFDDAVIDKKLKGHPVEALVAKGLNRVLGGTPNAIGGKPSPIGTILDKAGKPLDMSPEARRARQRQYRLKTTPITGAQD